MIRLANRRAAVSALVAALLGAMGCEQQVASASSDPQPEASPLRTPVRVRVAPVVEEVLAASCEASGVVSAFRRAQIAAEATGRVVERRVEPGQLVTEDQLLVRLDDARLQLAEEQAQAALQAREVDRAEARLELERGDRLAGDAAISKSRHDALRFAVDRAESAVELARVALRTAQRNRADAAVRAPFAGVVEEVRTHVGDLVRPGTPVATLVDLSRVRVRAGVTASETASLAPGAAARVLFTDLGGVALDAEVRSIGRVADPATGTYPVELWLDNPQGLLREGMVGRVVIPLARAQRKPVVPRAALLRRNGGMAVFVIDGAAGETRARARHVRTGHGDGEQIEILEGVSTGEQVVIDGLFALRDGAPVLVEKPSSTGRAADATPWND